MDQFTDEPLFTKNSLIQANDIQKGDVLVAYILWSVYQLSGDRAVFTQDTSKEMCLIGCRCGGDVGNAV